MADIVERLRKLDTATCEDAADEIERLRGGMLKMASTMSTQVETIERLRGALRWLEDKYNETMPVRTADMHSFECRCFRCAADFARAALEEK